MCAQFCNTVLFSSTCLCALSLTVKNMANEQPLSTKLYQNKWKESMSYMIQIALKSQQ